MKKHWRRGLLLGVSLVLLLSGGVALAASVKTQADPHCFECITRDELPMLPEGKFVELTNSGYAPGQNLSWRLTMKGLPWYESEFIAPLTGPPCWVRFFVLCENLATDGYSNCEVSIGETGFPSEVDPSAYPYAEHGEWIFRIWQNGDADEVSFRFAEVCEVEFVPEPGSILLLGSGLAGLAGYATLRWRTRE